MNEKALWTDGYESSKRQLQAIESDDEDCSSRHQPIPQIKRKRTCLATNRATLIESFDSFVTDDTFLYMLQFVVSPGGLVDGDSLQNMCLVCHRWRNLATKGSVWSNIRQEMNGNRPSSSIRDFVQRNSLRDVLIGFTKVSCISNVFQDGCSSCFWIRERASGKSYVLRVCNMADCDKFLPDIYLGQKFMGCTFLKRASSLFYLPVGVELCNDRAVVFYDWYEQTFRELLGPEKCEGDNSLLPQATLQRWFQQLLQIQSTIDSNLITGSIHDERIVVVQGDLKLIPFCSRAKRNHDRLHQHLLSSEDRLVGYRVELGTLMVRVAERAVHQDEVCVMKPCSPVFSKLSLQSLGSGGVNLLEKLMVPGESVADLLRESFFTTGSGLRTEIIDGDQNSKSMFTLSSEEAAAAKILEALNAEDNRVGKCDIESRLWATLVDWIVEMGSLLNLSDHCMYEAVELFALYHVKYGTNDRREFQLFLGTCMRISSLCESFTCDKLSRSDLVYSSDNMFTTADVQISEQSVLDTLQWRLVVPNILYFTSLFVAKLNDPSERLCLTIECVSEMALQTLATFQYRSSQIAASAILIACDMCGEQQQDCWPQELRRLTGYTHSSLHDCVNTILRYAEHIRLTLPDLQMIPRKYKGMNAPFEVPFQLPISLELRSV